MKTQTELIAILKRICETPAPTFAETQRAALLASYFEAAGLKPHLDRVGNVLAEVEGQGPRLLLAVHLDTVFSAETDVTVRECGSRLCAPGIGDNSASLSVLVYYLQNLAKHPKRPNLTVAATVGEEGLGDLYGMRELMKEAQNYDMMLALDGHLDYIVDQAVGSKRYEVNISAKGGHSWGDFPSPSALHALGDIISQLNHLPIPSQPRSSYNIGQVRGGSSINAIAEQAYFNLDLRSIEAETLQFLNDKALSIIEQQGKKHQVSLDIKQVGDRPTGQSDNISMVKAAKKALKSLDIEAKCTASSTDANAAMAVALPAITFGVYHGGDAHRLSEWMEPASMVTGYKALVKLLAELC
ncbi:MAG: M20/M25/M40 family metallo-hydrolase [Deinococcales bacterium]